jgi:phage terminase large subunit
VPRQSKTGLYWSLRLLQTNILPETELAAARKEMGDDKYFQEFECSFSAAVEGSYYGTILNELAEERFKEIPRDDLCKTFAAWDLGMGDSTAIWVVQVAGQEVQNAWTTLRITVRA